MKKHESCLPAGRLELIEAIKIEMTGKNGVMMVQFIRPEKISELINEDVFFRNLAKLYCGCVYERLD